MCPGRGEDDGRRSRRSRAAPHAANRHGLARHSPAHLFNHNHPRNLDTSRDLPVGGGSWVGHGACCCSRPRPAATGTAGRCVRRACACACACVCLCVSVSVSVCPWLWLWLWLCLFLCVPVPVSASMSVSVSASVSVPVSPQTPVYLLSHRCSLRWGARRAGPAAIWVAD